MYENFNRKSHLVKYGQKEDAPNRITYPSVVSMESICIDSIIVSLDDLDICACGIRNFYLNEKCRKNLWMVVGTYFVPLDRVLFMIIARYLYVMKSSG